MEENNRPTGPPDLGHQDWFVENEQELNQHTVEQCVGCYAMVTAAECEDGLCPDCRLRGLPGRSVLEEVSAIRRKVRNWLLLTCLLLLLFLLLQWLVSR